MANVVHMETEQTRTVAQQMERTADVIYEQVQSLSNAIHNLDWRGPSRDVLVDQIDGVLRSLASLSEAGSLLGMRVQREIDEWLLADNNGAAGFATPAGMAFLASLPATGIMAEFASVSAGQVLGASTSVYDYQAISWNEKFEQQRALDQAISTAQEQLADGLPTNLQEANDQIDDLDQQIADLEAQKAEAQKNADEWWNKVIPDWPLEGDSEDGVPWRVRADDYEDQIAEYDRQLASLRSDRDQLDAQRNILSNLSSLENRKNALNQVISDGIASDGPSAKHPYFPGTTTSNCTKYASLKRDVPCNGNAYQWDEQARAAGYDVGATPVKGAVMVWEKGVRGADPDNGHVSYVERVEPQNDGSVKIYYTDNGNNNSAKPSSITISPGEQGISFIYDKLPTN